MVGDSLSVVGHQPTKFGQGLPAHGLASEPLKTIVPQRWSTFFKKVTVYFASSSQHLLSVCVCVPLVVGRGVARRCGGDSAGGRWIRFRSKCFCIAHAFGSGTEEHRTFLTSGEQLGQRGCLFVEPQHATVRTVTTVQVLRSLSSVMQILTGIVGLPPPLFDH